ncbi:MAG: hypothetical protein PHV74_13170, partial [Dehalococcoidia bacterium]|nr:hypothetical protein [Dehalococcoidia bacterium]
MKCRSLVTFLVVSFLVTVLTVSTPTGVSAEAAISLSPDFGPAGTVITVSGSGFTASATGYVWFDTDNDGVKDAGEPYDDVTTDGSGNIPSDITVTAPTMTSSSYSVIADIPSGGSNEASGTFTKSNITTQVKITKYNAAGGVVSSQVKTYQELISEKTAYGNGTTHYYMQGPSFDDDSYNELWDSTELVNYESRDYGAAKGTDVKDLCAYVGGASAGDVIQIKAADGFTKSFDYEDVYNPEAAQGKLILTWYTTDTYEGEDDGYVGDGDYVNGMRLIFFAETTNSAGKYVFGNVDMNNTLPAS